MGVEEREMCTCSVMTQESCNLPLVHGHAQLIHCHHLAPVSQLERLGEALQMYMYQDLHCAGGKGKEE